MKTVVLSNAASRQMDALPHEVQGRIMDALHNYAMTGIGDIKAMSGRPSYRMRIGRYRVVFAEDQITVLALYIGKRETTTYNRG